MTIKPDHLRTLIRETLRYLEPEIPYSETAVELLMMTAAQETQLGKYLVQIRGPARGIYQVEPASEQHVLGVLKIKNMDLYKKLMAINSPADGQGSETDRDIIFNLAYATGLARCFYWLKPAPLPERRSGALAAYDKRYWNTHLGKATEAEAIAAYSSLCLPVRDA